MFHTGSADDNSGTKADVEASLAALPPPTETQRHDMGWTRNWAAAWADHEKKLATTYYEEGGEKDDEIGVETKRREASAAWKSREDLVAEGGGRVMFFDLTGGPVIRLAKERAMVRYTLLQIRCFRAVPKNAKRRHVFSSSCLICCFMKKKE